MLVADLVGKSKYYGYPYTIAKARVIALDARDCSKLFDTMRNKPEYIDQFMKGEITSLWADVIHVGCDGSNVHIDPVIKIFVSHNSWKRGE